MRRILARAVSTASSSSRPLLNALGKGPKNKNVIGFQKRSFAYINAGAQGIHKEQIDMAQPKDEQELIEEDERKDVQFK